MYFYVSKAFYINKLVTTTHYPTHVFTFLTSTSLYRDSTCRLFGDFRELQELSEPSTARSSIERRGNLNREGILPVILVEWYVMYEDIRSYHMYIVNECKWWYDLIKLSGKELFCDYGLWTLWTFIILCCASPKFTFTSTNSNTNCTTHWQPWDFAPADLKSACFIDAWNMNFQGTGPPYPATLSWRARWLSLLVHLQLVELTAQQKNKQWTWQGSTDISNVAMSMQQYRYRFNKNDACRPIHKHMV